MKFADYLDREAISGAAFAARIGVTRQAVHRYRQGRRPEWDVISAIVRETNGAVTADDFMTAEAAE